MLKIHVIQVWKSYIPGQIQSLKICVIRGVMVGFLGVDPGAENPRYPSLEKLYSRADPVAEYLRNPGWNNWVTWAVDSGA